MAKIDQPEHRLAHYCVELMERVLVGDVWFTAVDTGTQTVTKTAAARFAWENHRKFMGIKPNHLDLYVYQRDTGIYGQFELKWARNTPNDGQETTMRLLTERGIPNGWGRSVRDFCIWLKASRFKLHGNTANILAEVEAWHAAAQDAAEIGKSGPKRSAKPRTPKPTQGQLRKVGAVRARAAAAGIRF